MTIRLLFELKIDQSNLFSVGHRTLFNIFEIYYTVFLIKHNHRRVNDRRFTYSYNNCHSEICLTLKQYRLTPVFITRKNKKDNRKKLLF